MESTNERARRLPTREQERFFTQADVVEETTFFSSPLSSHLNYQVSFACTVQILLGPAERLTSLHPHLLPAGAGIDVFPFHSVQQRRSFPDSRGRHGTVLGKN